MTSNKPSPSLLDWLATFPFLLAFGLCLALFDPIQRLCRLFGQRPHDYSVATLQWCLTQATRLCGTRIEVERDADIQPKSGYLLIANHQSMFDIPIIGGTLFTNFPKYVAKRELGKWIPSISYNLRRGGNSLINRRDRKQAVAAIQEMGRNAQARGVSAVIFPEGTRARGGALGKFKPGGTMALLESATDLPVIPVTIAGSWRFLLFNLWPVPWGTRIRIKYGKPMPRTQSDEALFEEAEKQIDATLCAWRNGEGK